MNVHQTTNLLHRAQNAYGYANQVTVATEELCELGAVLSKYPRYPDHDTASEKLRPRIVEEIADVVICLQHLYMIFGITEEELQAQMDVKLNRLARWLDTTDDFYQTTVDRAVKPTHIEPCNCALCNGYGGC